MRIPLWAAALGALAWTAQAFEVAIDQTLQQSQQCAGMYSKSTWGGDVDPFIEVVFDNSTVKEGTDPIVSLVIFEWKDFDLVGVKVDNFENDMKLCGNAEIKAKLCNQTNKGEYVVAPPDIMKEKSKSLVRTKAVHLNNPHVDQYPIKKTGYYCVLTAPFSSEDLEYRGAVVFRNAYGELPATQIPKLPFYGGITILYALVAVYWGFLYYQHRHDILPVQNYITAILVFLVVEMLMTWGFYDYQNNHGQNIGAKVLLVIVAILNAGRNSFSFFLLLIVCMGYGVVKPTLGRTMIYVRWLAVAHFVFGLVYAMVALYVNPDDAGPFLLLIVLPLAGTLTAFYVWTLNSLKFTLKDLVDRKQNAKASMYKKLWWCILVSIFVIFGFFFFNSLSFANVRDPDFVPFHWKTRWFILDGWLNLVYFADVAFVAYVWRPTANNRRFAMSDEIAQDDDGTFEIADIGAPDDSDDDDDDLELGKNRGSANAPSAAQAASAPAGASSSSSGPAPMPNAAPQRNAPRDSLDGETIFAVGDDDKMSDDESSDEERSKLVPGKKKD